MKYSLTNQDCFEYIKSIKDNSVSLVLIDPPYEISRCTNFSIGEKETSKFNVSMDFGNWDYGFTGLNDIIKECYRVLKDSGTIICFYDLWKITNLKNILEETKFKQIRFIEWIKTNPVPLNSKRSYLTNCREVALVGAKGNKPTFHSKYDNGVYRFPICHGKNRFHPTQKPVELLEELIEKHSDEGDLILDCFAGSGSTAVAAYNLNRNFTGCELDKEYFDKAMDRLIKIGAINQN